MLGGRFSHLDRTTKTSVFSEQVHNKMILVLLVAAIFMCFFVYLWQVNGMATKGYKIKDLQTRVYDLKDQNKKLELQVADLRSSARISEKIKEMNLVEVVRIEYLIDNSGSVAVNR